MAASKEDHILSMDGQANNVKNVAAVTIFPTGPAKCNCVLILERETGHLVIINPGGDFRNIIAELKSLCIEADVGLNKVRLAYILITQAHAQLFLAAGEMLELGNGAGEIILHEEDWFLWERAELQAQELDFPELLPKEPFPKPNRSFEQGEELTDCGSLSIVCLHTPGVSPGSACFYFPQIELVCTGTTLLSQSVGRTSWMGIRSLEGTSSARTMRRSIDDVLLASVPGDTRVVPAFGPLTTLRHEAQKNAHLQKLSSRWGAYNDSMEMKSIQEARIRKQEEDPYGDGLPF